MYPPSGVIRPQPLMGWMDSQSCLGCDSDDHDETEVCTERSLAVNSRCPPNGADTYQGKFWTVIRQCGLPSIGLLCYTIFLPARAFGETLLGAKIFPHRILHWFLTESDGHVPG